eukprot:jgi/Mesvir1/18630/Mv17139-RA.1
MWTVIGGPHTTLFCPVSSEYPDAGIARPTFVWTGDNYQSPYVGALDVEYDNAPEEEPLAPYITSTGSIYFRWNTSNPPTGDDIRAANLIAKLFKGTYSLDNLYILAPSPAPSGDPPGHYLVITDGDAPIPLEDFQNADDTLSDWTFHQDTPTLVRYTYNL